ncbi:Helicase associated domain protein [Streptomyces noursei]|uniref:DEAD/DEAH box helicase n=1 Tax=Streptomyces noursei TaxID=1971 RepID=UPI0037A34466
MCSIARGDQIVEPVTEPAAIPTPRDATRPAAPESPVVQAPRPGVIPLRPHQKDGVSNLWRALKDGGRAIVEAACGSGKTLMAAAAARRMAAKGRVLVLVPTIELLDQTATAWSILGRRRGRAIGACSHDEALELAEAGAHSDVTVTTDAGTLAHLVTSATGPVTVYATYASLQRIVTAHADHQLPTWDLIVIDEAHRTAGAADKPWAAVHQDDKVPAQRRANFTATPRIVDLAPGETVDSTTVYSMDNEDVFGKTVYRLTAAQGIALGLIADYEVLVPVVTDEDLRELLIMPAIADLRSQRTNAELQELALGVGLLRAMTDEDLYRILTYHSRVDAARSFAAALPRIAKLLPAQQRPKLWTRAVAGTDRLKTRREIFADFGTHTPGSDERAVLSNSRLLSEGVDLPGVDAVVFADPKSSVIDIVQAIGRALRQKPGQGKKARIIIPVYLPAIGDDEQTPTDAAAVNDAATNDEHRATLAASAFKTVWQVLQALAAHDGRMIGRITELRSHRATPLARSDESSATTAEDGAEAEAPFAWLKINASDHKDAILRALRLRSFSPRTEDWERNYTRAKAFFEEQGHLDVRDGPLVSWLNQQRYLYAKGLLPPDRINKLNAIGMIWDRHEHAWDRGFAHALVWYHKHGNLAIPTSDVHDGFSRGRWMQRQRHNIDDLTNDQRARLDALDPRWALDPLWVRGYRRWRAYLAAGGTLTGSSKRPGPDSDPAFLPGRWQRRQIAAAKAGKLNTQQIDLLDASGDWRTI